MEDFEDAVEIQTLHQLLKQDQDYDDSSHTEVDSTIGNPPDAGKQGHGTAGQGDVSASTSGKMTKTVGEAELERLMREMSDADLDVLAGELSMGLGGDKSKIASLEPSPAGDEEDTGGSAVAEGGGSGGFGKIGLMVPDGAEPVSSAVKEAESGSQLDTLGVKGTGEVIRDPALDVGDRLSDLSMVGRGDQELDGKGAVQALQGVLGGLAKSEGKEKVD
jgi:hypothetical protein